MARVRDTVTPSATVIAVTWEQGAPRPPDARNASFSSFHPTVPSEGLTSGPHTKGVLRLLDPSCGALRLRSFPQPPPVPSQYCVSPAASSEQTTASDAPLP
eukprot:749595-Hanusia_phi.AAC.1